MSKMSAVELHIPEITNFFLHDSRLTILCDDSFHFVWKYEGVLTLHEKNFNLTHVIKTEKDVKRVAAIFALRHLEAVDKDGHIFKVDTISKFDPASYSFWAKGKDINYLWHEMVKLTSE